MGILIGFGLVSLGVGGVIGFLPHGSPLILEISAALIISGAIVICFSYGKGRRIKLSQLNKRVKKQCPGCNTNVTDDCSQCPRCGMNL